MSKETELAELMIKARSFYDRQNIISLDKESQDEACRELNTGVLSLAAISAVVGVSPYRVEKAIRGMPRPTTRGHLNPAHLSWLAYGLSKGDVKGFWVRAMLDDGTSLSTISDLTLISEATLYRRRDEE